MYSHLLSAPQLVAMSESPDLSALVGLLKRTEYGPYLGGVRDSNAGPQTLMVEIRNRLAAMYGSVIQGAPLQARRVLLQLFRHHEVSNLKAVLRGIAGGAAPEKGLSTWEQVRGLLFPMGMSSAVPAQSMAEAGSVAAAVDMLQGTPYYAPLSQALKRYSSERSLFPLEVALDLHYWRQLWQEARKLPVQDQTQASRVLGALVDMNNLMWAIRYRVYQDLSEEELINYTLPFGHRVLDEDIRAIAAGADIGSVVGRIYPSLPGVDALLAKPKAGLPELEARLKRHLLEECLEAFIGNPFHIGLPIAYLVLQDLEVEDLVVLIEAKSSRLDARKLRPLLHRLDAVHA